MSFQRGTWMIAMVMAGSVAVPGTVYADKTGAFIGGMITSRVLTNMERRTKAEEAQAYRAPPPQAAPAPQAAPPAASAKRTPEQKLQELDRLAAGGYISPEEYKARRQAVLDSM